MRALLATLGAAVLALPSFGNATVITSITVTPETQSSGTALGGLLSVSAPPYPLDTSTGPGLLVNAAIAGFGVHSHQYDAPSIPTNAIVTFGFDVATVVDTLEVIQHANGITRIEGFVGDTLGSMASLGNIFGPDGDVTGTSHFFDGQSYAFDFNNLTSGLYYSFVITKTSEQSGYAAFKFFPRDITGQRIPAADQPVPAPSTALLAMLGLGALRVRESLWSGQRGGKRDQPA